MNQIDLNFECFLKSNIFFFEIQTLNINLENDVIKLDENYEKTRLTEL